MAFRRNHLGVLSLLSAAGLASCGSLSGNNRINHLHSDAREKAATAAQEDLKTFAESERGLGPVMLENLRARMALAGEANGREVALKDAVDAVEGAKGTWADVRRMFYETVWKGPVEKVPMPMPARPAEEFEKRVAIRLGTIVEISRVLAALAAAEAVLGESAEARIKELREMLEPKAPKPSADNAEKEKIKAEEAKAEKASLEAAVRTALELQRVVRDAAREYRESEEFKKQAETKSNSLFLALESSRDPDVASAIVPLLNTGLDDQSLEMLNRFLTTLRNKLDERAKGEAASQTPREMRTTERKPTNAGERVLAPAATAASPRQKLEKLTSEMSDGFFAGQVRVVLAGLTEARQVDPVQENQASTLGGNPPKQTHIQAWEASNPPKKPPLTRVRAYNAPSGADAGVKADHDSETTLKIDAYLAKRGGTTRSLLNEQENQLQESINNIRSAQALARSTSERLTEQSVKLTVSRARLKREIAATLSPKMEGRPEEKAKDSGASNENEGNSNPAPAGGSSTAGGGATPPVDSGNSNKKGSDDSAGDVDPVNKLIREAFDLRQKNRDKKAFSNQAGSGGKGGEKDRPGELKEQPPKEDPEEELGRAFIQVAIVSIDPKAEEQIKAIVDRLGPAGSDALKNLGGKLQEVFNEKSKRKAELVRYLADIYGVELELRQENARHSTALGAVMILEIKRWKALKGVSESLSGLYPDGGIAGTLFPGDGVPATAFDTLPVTPEDRVLPSLRGLAKAALLDRKVSAANTKLLFEGKLTERLGALQEHYYASIDRVRKADKLLNGFLLLRSLNTHYAADNALRLETELREHDLLVSGIESELHTVGFRHELNELSAYHASGVTADDIHSVARDLALIAIGWGTNRSK